MSYPKSIYIHLPFCMTKCPYCDFASFAINNKPNSNIEKYLAALNNEIDARSRELKTKPVIETVFFGGGTPSIHSASEIESILNKLRDYFVFSDRVEITLEANPGTVSFEKLNDFKKAGINRISFGAQTFDQELLMKLGRGHSLDDTFRTLEDLINLDFNSWSFDLIYGLPGQSLESWQRTIEKALSYSPPHISVYALSIEQNTPYGNIYKNSFHPDLPKEEILVEMYEHAHDEFQKNKMYRYEISNWAKPGHEARHNITYWQAEEYFAFGISAHGYYQKLRYANTRDMESYLKDSKSIDRITTFSQLIDDEESKREEVMLKMRLASGLQLGPRISSILDFDRLAEMENLGFLEKNNDVIRLTTQGVLLSNMVISKLIKETD